MSSLQVININTYQFNDDDFSRIDMDMKMEMNLEAACFLSKPTNKTFGYGYGCCAPLEKFTTSFNNQEKLAGPQALVEVPTPDDTAPPNQNRMTNEQMQTNMQLLVVVLLCLIRPVADKLLKILQEEQSKNMLDCGLNDDDENHDTRLEVHRNSKQVLLDSQSLIRRGRPIYLQFHVLLDRPIYFKIQFTVRKMKDCEYKPKFLYNKKTYQQEFDTPEKKFEKTVCPLLKAICKMAEIRPFSPQGRTVTKSLTPALKNARCGRKCVRWHDEVDVVCYTVE